MRKEYYYSRERFETAGVDITYDSYIVHIKDFFAGQRTVPVTKTTSQWDFNVYFTFANQLLRLFLDRPGLIGKPYQCAWKYGFRGFSTGAKNGIFYVRKEDKNLLKVAERLKERLWDEICLDLDIHPSHQGQLKAVKIVWHNPSGERIVGQMNEVNHRIVFLGFASP